MYSSLCGDSTQFGNAGNTALRLDCCGYGTHETVPSGNIRANNGVQVTPPDDGCKLILGLGPTPCAYSDEHSPSGGNKSNGMSTVLNHGVSSQRGSLLKLELRSDPDAVTNVLEFSASKHCPDATHSSDPVSSDVYRVAVPIVDEGSSSAKRSGGYLAHLRAENAEILWARNKSLELGSKSCGRTSQLSSEPSALSNYSISAVSEPGSAAVSSNHGGRSTKRCKFSGCTKGARGATSLCIGHGGGQRCQKLGCNKGAESRTAFCKSHGGGRRCQHLGCTKSAEGSTDHCIAHGGGKRCGHPGSCTKAARGKSGLCIRHGGGKRCKVDGCTRSAEGKVGLCISHGGGRRCHFLGCNKGAQGSTMFCKAHGGGKRCIFAGCSKGAEGNTPLCKGHGGGRRCMLDGGGICPRSVHGGTHFCVAHGGGKRCAIPGCSKSARGRTDHCVRHGGGKRCKLDNCGKSAQGSTEFCKAHGGGRRCSWAEGKCGKFARGRSGLCAAHSSLLHGRETTGGGMLGPGLFHGLVHGSSFDKTCSSSMFSDSMEKPMKQQQLIPPEVLVPQSMKACLGSEKSSSKEVELAGPEGRVHGGGLLSLLGGNLSNATHPNHNMQLP